MTNFNQLNTQKVAIAQSAIGNAHIGGTVQRCTLSDKSPLSRYEIEVRAAQVRLGWSDQERRSRRRAGRLAFLRLVGLVD
jgi:hypothetical protein